MKKTVYEKAEVETILKIILEETDVAIDKAFAEGYKQGLLLAKPDAEYFKVFAEELQKENARLQRRQWWTIPVAIIGGITTGVVITLAVK
ncbi:MAG: hypothetical protein P1P59_09140 [Treponemataceae bacterium]